MNISEIFIRRPVMTTLVMAGIVIFGLMSYNLLPISALPNIEYPFISVSASLPGATPETMASSVAAPLERQFTEISGLNSFNSTSSTGSTNISLQFDFSRTAADAAKDVQAAISAAAGQLPPGMPKPPTYRKVNPSVAPILYLYLYSETLPISDVDEYAEITLGQPISTLNGVAQVQVFGQKQYAVRVQVDPQQLASRGISVSQIRTAIQEGSVNLPIGSLSGPTKSYMIQANGQRNNATEWRELIVAYKNGATVRLQDVAQVIDDVQNNKVSNRFYDQKVANKPSIVLAVQPQPGANTVEIVDNIKQLLPTLRSQIPKSIEMGILYDRSISIRASIDDVKFTLFLSVCLVVLVIFLFLRDFRATLIPSLALPIAILGTFAVMYLLGYSLDNLSLMALTLSVGFVVDDAVVVLENIVRHREQGEAALEAALNGSKEIGFTIVSMTLSLVAVFIPLLFMGGLLGRLFHEFAVTLAVAILVSGFVSLSLTPMLCSRFLTGGQDAHPTTTGILGGQDAHPTIKLTDCGTGILPVLENGGGGQDAHPTRKLTDCGTGILPVQKNGAISQLYRISEQAFDLLLRAYELTLKPVLKYRFATLALSVVLLFATVYLFTLVPKGFIPSEDTGQIMANTKAAQNISFDDMLRHQQKVVEILRKDPNIAALNSTVGASGPNASVNSGRITISLKPRSQRNLNSDEIIQQLMPKLRGIPGIKVFLRSPPAIPIGGQQTNSQYQFTVQSLNVEELRQYVPQLLEKVRTLPGIRQVDSDLQLSTPQVQVKVDHNKAASLGISVQQVEQTLSAAFGSGQVSTMYTPNDQFYVILEVAPQYQRDPSALSLLYVASSSGQQVPLSAIAQISENVGPLTVAHLAELPSATISFDVAPGVSLNQATDAIKQAAQAILPITITPSFQGSAQAFQQSFNDLGLLLLVSILVIYLILGILYEDFIHPITILSGLPSAGFGALLTLVIFDVELNVYSFIGIILLVGIVKKNGIMMVDFAVEAQRKEGKSPLDAIFAACLTRFRPIMMTTAAALMGTLPIALGLGAGSEARRPLGIAIVGGLLFSQIVTLYLTPVVYTYMEALRPGVGKKKQSQVFSPQKTKYLN